MQIEITQLFIRISSRLCTIEWLDHYHANVSDSVFIKLHKITRSQERFQRISRAMKGWWSILLGLACSRSVGLVQPTKSKGWETFSGRVISNLRICHRCSCPRIFLRLKWKATSLLQFRCSCPCIPLAGRGPLAIGPRASFLQPTYGGRASQASPKIYIYIHTYVCIRGARQPCFNIIFVSILIWDRDIVILVRKGIEYCQHL